MANVFGVSFPKTSRRRRSSSLRVGNTRRGGNSAGPGGRTTTRAPISISRRSSRIQSRRWTLISARMAAGSAKRRLQVSYRRSRRSNSAIRSQTALAFKLVRVHDPLGHYFIRTKSAALTQHSVDQRRLTVIHVSNDGDVANRRIQITPLNHLTQPNPCLGDSFTPRQPIYTECS